MQQGIRRRNNFKTLKPFSTEHSVKDGFHFFFQLIFYLGWISKKNAYKSVCW